MREFVVIYGWNGNVHDSISIIVDAENFRSLWFSFTFEMAEGMVPSSSA